jgi:outer membrane protein TolC
LEASNLSLNEAIAIALKQNQSLIVSSYNPKIQENEILRAHALFDTQLSTTYLHTDSKTALQLESQADAFNTTLSKYNSYGSRVSLNYAQNINDSNPALSLSSSTPAYTSSLGVGISQNLLKDFGENINHTKIEIASKTHQSSKYLFLKEIINTVYDVQIAYWDLYEAQKNYELEEYGLSLIEELFQQKERMVELGGFPKALLQEIVASRADTLTTIAVASKKLKLSQMNFLLVMGTQEEFQIVDTPQEHTIKNFDNDTLWIQQHPDLLVNQIEIEKYAQLAKYYDNQLLPSLSVHVNYAMHNPSSQESHLSPYNKEHYLLNSGVTLSMPLDNTNAKSDMTKNRLEKLSAAAKRDKLLHEITLSVKKAKSEIDTIKEITKLSKMSVKAQEEIMKQEDRKLELGLTTMKNYLDNMSALIVKKKKLLSYECDMMRSFATYYKATGTMPDFLNIDVSEFK